MELDRHKYSHEYMTSDGFLGKEITTMLKWSDDQLIVSGTDHSITAINPETKQVLNSTIINDDGEIKRLNKIRNFLVVLSNSKLYLWKWTKNIEFDDETACLHEYKHIPEVSSTLAKICKSFNDFKIVNLLVFKDKYIVIVHESGTIVYDIDDPDYEIIHSFKTIASSIKYAVKFDDALFVISYDDGTICVNSIVTMDTIKSLDKINDHLMYGYNLTINYKSVPSLVVISSNFNEIKLLNIEFETLLKVTISDWYNLTYINGLEDYLQSNKRYKLFHILTFLTNLILYHSMVPIDDTQFAVIARDNHLEFIVDQDLKNYRKTLVREWDNPHPSNKLIRSLPKELLNEVEKYF
jgi:hypothetical protein